MFKIDMHECAGDALHAYDNTGPDTEIDECFEVTAKAVCVVLSHQLRSDPRGASLPEDLGDAIEVLLASHKAMQEAGEEMPSAHNLCVDAAGSNAHLLAPSEWRRLHEKAEFALEVVRPTIARLRRERDEARTVSDALAEQCRGLAETLGRTAEERNDARKAERVWRELQERAIPCGHKVEDLIGGAGQVTKCGACLAEKQAARCVDTADIGITKPPPPPPPPSIVAVVVHRDDGTTEEYEAGTGRRLR